MDILVAIPVALLLALLLSCHVRSLIYWLWRWPAYTCAKCGGHRPVEWIFGRECADCTYDPTYRPW